MKHGKYSKSKEVRPYVLIQKVERYDGTFKYESYFKTQEQALQVKKILEEKDKSIEKNEYYKGTTYEIKFIGTEKF